MSTPKPVYPGKTILASKIAAQYSDEIKQGVAELDFKPTLVGFLANDDPAAVMYANWSAKTTESLGFTYKLIQCDKNDLEMHILKANETPSVHGIMVYFPVFGDLQDLYLQQCVSPHKDVEGLNHLYYRNMYHNIRFLDEQQQQKSILPCTPLAVVKIMEYLQVYNPLIDYGNRLYGKKVVIVNRSEIVGRPLAALLANDGATVYSVDINNIQEFTRGNDLSLSRHQVKPLEGTSQLNELISEADVIITGVPTAAYKFPTEAVKNGAVCINFSSEKNFREDIKTKAGLYVPNIGKVTQAMLLRNLLRLIENKKRRENAV
ncbi:hypothetical protein BABINDRAFT_33757 [Babjeviella inositovora NRRL Y-12698]|uniref:Methylenetetrahydrofolate dehydrogenase [NAD(+)] n=1 Tax=Babjeviella inositovora NRRL Y-12698 TaxID=984486 RepID=A0A1E3QVN1_9ASCO|nr:uncharacterized protein BABINDRAFT_33757 [Babjeviella inositovora NRRL Y-12698]ODQ81132.1 hypothetical protein BABINDRAFT_33757 [Babjeviella inositovora NRRL Y-12698]